MAVSSALPLLADHVTLCELGVDNLRALRMEQPVELRRLTLLAGRNGIGKSTFARVFPLLRQSAGRRKREPILWWERGEVDFGGFETAIRRGAEEVTFTFGFEDSWGIRWTARSVLVHDDDGWSQVCRVAIEEHDSCLTLRFDDRRLVAVEGRGPNDSFTASDDEGMAWLLPRIKVEPDRLFAVPDPTAGRFSQEYSETLSRIQAASPRMTEDLKLRDGLGFWLGMLPWTNEQELLEGNSREVRQLYQGLLEDKVLDSRLRRLNFAREAHIRLFQAEALAREIGDRTAYLGPFRAAPERAYAPQGVAVDRLDPRGANLAMFLVALSPEEREDLNVELRARLGFAVSIEAAGGHYSIHVEQHDGRYNLIDMGYGYSQMLPVMVQLWASRRTLSTRRQPGPDAMVVIEQPELHLHPHQQVLLGRALGAFAADDHGPMHIIETHSEHLIGEIGRMIARGQLAPERVGVLCFEPHDEGGTKVSQATFNEHGVLHDWPVGFLSP